MLETRQAGLPAFASGPSGPAARSARLAPLQRLAAGLTGSPWFWAVLVGASFGFPLVRALTRPLPTLPTVLGTMPDFALADPSGLPVTSASLNGQVVLYEFTSPARLSALGSPMSAIRRRVRNAGEAVMLVSLIEGRLSADQAARLANGPARWTLATGETRAAESQLAALIGLPGEASLVGRLLLVDRAGRLRRVTGTGAEDVDSLMRDIALLMNMEGASR